MKQEYISRCAEIVATLSSVLAQRGLTHEARVLKLRGASFVTNPDATIHQELFGYIKRLAVREPQKIGQLATKAYLAFPVWNDVSAGPLHGPRDNEVLFNDFAAAARAEMN